MSFNEVNLGDLAKVGVFFLKKALFKFSLCSKTVEISRLTTAPPPKTYKNIAVNNFF